VHARLLKECGAMSFRCEIYIEWHRVLRHHYRPEYPMQTLNVGAGRTDEEYKAAEEQRREELNNDVKTYARYFFIAAGCAGLGGGLFFVKLNLVVNIGAIDLALLYGRELFRTNPLLWPMVTATWMLMLTGLGFAAGKAQRWAFWAGIILYGADVVLLMLPLNLWSGLAMGVHSFFIMQWFKGQKALEEINEAARSQRSIAAGTV
jgi:hypothetical protein